MILLIIYLFACEVVRYKRFIPLSNKEIGIVILFRSAAIHLIPMGTDQHSLVEQSCIRAHITVLPLSITTHVVHLEQDITIIHVIGYMFTIFGKNNCFTWNTVSLAIERKILMSLSSLQTTHERGKRKSFFCHLKIQSGLGYYLIVCLPGSLSPDLHNNPQDDLYMRRRW